MSKARMLGVLDSLATFAAGQETESPSAALEPVEMRPLRIPGSVIGRLIGFADAGATPLVTFPGQPSSAALRARTTVDLQVDQIGCQAVLVFEESKPDRPIVIGCVREANAPALGRQGSGGEVAVDADGKRLIVSARDEVVLRCGKASITLTKEGKVLVQGTYLSSYSSGAHRIRGGSVQIN